MQVMDLFAADSEVKRVFLRGSLATWATDEYSDIDIGIDVSGSNDAAFALSVPARIMGAFDVHLFD